MFWKNKQIPGKCDYPTDPTLSEKLPVIDVPRLGTDHVRGSTNMWVHMTISWCDLHAEEKEITYKTMRIYTEAMQGPSLLAQTPWVTHTWIPIFHQTHSRALLKRKFHPHVREHVYARVLSVLHYVSSDLQRGTEGIFSPPRLELSVKCLSSLIISIRVTGDRAFCSERTYCKNCQIEFVSRSSISIHSGS